ncbi:MAG TPA: hypothetical protein ACQGQF_00695, partial [Xylella fastidiosa subsp. pauca]
RRRTCLLLRASEEAGHHAATSLRAGRIIWIHLHMWGDRRQRVHVPGVTPRSPRVGGSVVSTASTSTSSAIFLMARTGRDVRHDEQGAPAIGGAHEA